MHATGLNSQTGTEGSPVSP